MSEMIDKQNVIDLVSLAIGDDWCVDYTIDRINEMPVVNKEDIVSRQQVIDTIMGEPSETHYPCYFAEMIRKLPAAQPELADEQSIAHLQSSGWMQRHDKEMYESGLKEQLADDSDSYDSLLPTVQPERIWHSCKTPPKHHKDVLVRGTEAIGNVTIYKVMQWDVDAWRPTNYAPSIIWEEWSEI